MWKYDIYYIRLSLKTTLYSILESDTQLYTNIGVCIMTWTRWTGSWQRWTSLFFTNVFKHVQLPESVTLSSIGDYYRPQRVTSGKLN